MRDNQREQIRQHRCIAHRVERDIDRPDLQRLRVEARVQIARMVPVFGIMLLALAFAFAHDISEG